MLAQATQSEWVVRTFGNDQVNVWPTCRAVPEAREDQTVLYTASFVVLSDKEMFRLTSLSSAVVMAQTKLQS
jgi:hypothetical protein